MSTLSKHEESLWPRAVLLLFAIMFGSMIVWSHMADRTPHFVSSEVHFTDPSASGLQIVPASCPSDPDYAGQCSLPVEGTCGLDVSLVIDTSGSIDNTELSQMKSALQAFVNALLPETPTMFSVVSFDDVATTRLQFFPNGNKITSVSNAIAAIDGSGSTNWQGALLAAQNTFDPRPAANNLILFASDGNPTATNSGSASESTAVSAAVTVANSIKSAGTRILTIGIGNGLDTANLQAIASPNSVFLSDFSTLATDLASVAREQCGGTITVKKIFDVDGNLGTTNDQAPAAGWDFTVAGVSKTTDFLGYTESFRVSGFGPWSVEEIPQSGYDILDASCTGATDNGTLTGSIINGIIGGVKLTQDNIVSCVFYNRGGTSGPDLTALNTSPTSASMGVPVTLSAIVTNRGAGSTPAFVSFPNFFQVASAPNGGGIITDLTPAISLPSLRGGTSNDISRSYTFAIGGAYSTRACADKSNAGSAGVIAETNENNNCSAWIDVSVTDDQPVACPPGSTLPACQQTCPPGTTLYTNGQCIPDGCQVGSALPGCAAQCPVGAVLVGGVCQYDSCQPGYVLQSGQCIPLSCEAGFVLQGGTCVPVSCQIGSTLIAGSCVFTGCPVGYTQVGQSCVFDACPLGWTFDGTQCISNECTNMCSGDNVVSSCGGALVQVCTNGCFAGGCIGTPPPAITTWRVTPLLVRAGTPVQVSWAASDVQLCTVRGTNGDGSGNNVTGLWNAATGANTSSPISSQTIFTLTCLGLPGATPTSVTQSSTVNILPIFNEE